MSLFALYHQREPATYAGVCDALAGNLCRCTGYRPIIDAALATCDGKPADRFAAATAERAAALAALADGRDLFVGDDHAFFAAPASEASLAALYARYSRAPCWSAARPTSACGSPSSCATSEQIIWLGRVAGLDAIEEGGGRPAHRRARDASTRRAASRRAPSRPRRIDAALRLAPGARERHGRRQHRQRLADRRSRAGADRARRAARTQARRRDARAAARGLLPRLRQAGSRRGRIRARHRRAAARRQRGLSRLQGHQAVRRGHFRRDGRLPLHARRAGGSPARASPIGGMAATPKRAADAEAALAGVSLDDPASWATAQAALAKPTSRRSPTCALPSAYRAEVAANLLKKALIEVSGAETPTRIGEALAAL